MYEPYAKYAKNYKTIRECGANHRDLSKSPFTDDERRVMDYIVSYMPGMSNIDDPISFLIASHAAFRDQVISNPKSKVVYPTEDWATD